MRNPWLIAFLLWLVAIVLAVFALRQLPLANLLRTAFQLSLWQLLVWIALNLAILLLSAQRWRELLLALATPVSRMRLLGNRLAGQTISFLTPVLNLAVNRCRSSGLFAAQGSRCTAPC